VIAHMGIARVDVRPWRLTVAGLVEWPFELDYEALTSLPATDVTAVLECFGNPVEPEVATRRVGNVVWRGVRLSHLLERAGVRPEARGARSPRSPYTGGAGARCAPCASWTCTR